MLVGDRRPCPTRAQGAEVEEPRWTPPELLPDHQVPVLLRRHHVKSGYRPLHRPAHYYVRSAFRWHNELVSAVP